MEGPVMRRGFGALELYILAMLFGMVVSSFYVLV